MLCMQVHGEGGIGVGAGVDGVIIVIVLGDHDPLRNNELLFQVMSDGLLLLPSEGSGALTRPCLIWGLACSRHGSDESLLLSVRSSNSGLSHSHGIILLPLGGGGGHGGSGVLPIDDGVVFVAAWGAGLTASGDDAGKP
jgi:hypothetical protein